MANPPISYFAFLRGIGPGDPLKSNESLRKVFESCGFKNVRSFISSGNILFSSTEKNTEKLERTIEQGFKKNLGIEIGTFVRSKEEIEQFLKTAPFGKLKHGPKSYLIVTFYKKADKETLAQFQKSEGKRVLRVDSDLRAVCSAVDTTAAKTPDFLGKLERTLGKEITTRTINTVERMYKRL